MTVPIPPPHLMKRVAGNDDPQQWERVGIASALLLMGAVSSWSHHPVENVLDFGCGSGRVAAHLATWPGVLLYGCDVDAEAIAWCADHIRGSFTPSPLWPPLGYPDGTFDAVIAVSVFTHLPRRAQSKWLRELARVLRPGGVLVASVHGHAVAEAYGKPMVPIQDDFINTDMAGVVPDGYYVNVLQSESYTRRAWSERFDVVAYEPAALELHDLVVLRSR